MSSLPIEQTKASSGAAISGGGTGEVQSPRPVPFLTKLYQMVDDPAIDELISWNEDGSGFIVWHPDEFARDLLPHYFKHNNFSSFVRQLNIYGFRKMAESRWEFKHECFRRGQEALLRNIQRRKISPAASTVTVAVPAPSTSGDSSLAQTAKVTEMAKENDRLKKENARLREEITRWRSLCSNVCSLILDYTGNGEVVATTGGATNTVKPEEEMSLRLFGFSGKDVKSTKDEDTEIVEHWTPIKASTNMRLKKRARNC